MKTTVTARTSNDKLFVKVDKGSDVSLKVADAVKAIKNSAVNGGDVKLIVEVPVETISGSYDAASVSYIGGYDSEKKAYIFVDENKTEYIFTDIKLALNQFANDILGDAVTVKLAEQTDDTSEQNKVMQQELFGVIVDETPRHVEITMHGNKTPLFSITVDGRAIYNGKANWSKKDVDEWVMNAYENRAQCPNMTIEVPEVVAALYLNSFACHPNIIRELNVTLIGFKMADGTICGGKHVEEKAAIEEQAAKSIEATTASEVTLEINVEDYAVSTEAATAAKDELPTGDITVESGAEAFALIGKYFPADGLNFDGIDYYYGKHYCYFNGDTYKSVVATCDKENRRIEYVQIVDHKQNGMGLKKHYPLTVRIEPKKNAEVDASEYAISEAAMEIAIEAEIELANAEAIREQILNLRGEIYYRKGAIKDLDENHIAKHPDDESLKELRAEWVVELTDLKAQLAELTPTEVNVDNYAVNLDSQEAARAEDDDDALIPPWKEIFAELEDDPNADDFTKARYITSVAYTPKGQNEELPWHCASIRSTDFARAEKALELYKSALADLPIEFVEEPCIYLATAIIGDGDSIPVYYAAETDGTEEDSDENIWNFIPDVEELNDVELEQVEKEGCAAKSEHDDFRNHKTKDLRGELSTSETPIVGNSSSEKICDSLFRAMEFALKRIQKYCREMNVSAAINEMKLYSICRAALPDRCKAG